MTLRIVWAAAVLLLLPFIAMRRRALMPCLALQLILAAMAAVVWRQTPSIDPYLAATALVVLELALFSILFATARGDQVRWSANRAAVMALLVYSLAVPAMLRTPIDGDEPFYLLVTESLVHDHDLDLRNQFRDISHSATRRPDLKPQYGDPVGREGQQYSRTELFLSILLIPGFVLGGLKGAVATLAIFGALLVRSTVRWMEEEGVADATTRAIFPLFAFAPPVVFYSARIWPEVPGALAFVEALRGVRQRRPRRWILALTGLVLLKLRFILVALPLLLATIRRRRHAVIAAVVIAIPLVIAWAISGSAAGVHAWRELLPYAPSLYLNGLFGLLLDGAAGLLFQAPFYLLGILALSRWRESPEGFRLGCLAAVLYVLYLVPRSEWYGGWSPPLRYIVVFTPVLALGAASIWRRINPAVIGLIAIWSIGIVIHGATFPWRLFHIANGENPAGEALSRMYESDFSRLFPSFIRVNDAALVAGIALVIAMIGFAFAGRIRVPSMLVVAACAALLAWGYQAGRQPGRVVELEDAHVVHHGGELFPKEYAVMRFAYRGGWIVRAGETLSFLALGGPALLDYSAGERAVIELDGHRYTLSPNVGYSAIPIDIPHSGRVLLRCISGSANLEKIRSIR